MTIKSLRKTFAPLLLFLLFAATVGGADTEAPAESPPPAAIDFSDYYPLVRGTFRKFEVQRPGKKAWTVTQVTTNGVIYEGKRAVRNVESFVEWDDEILSGGQVLGLAGSDEFGNVASFDPPLIKGIGGWVLRDPVTTLSTIRIGEASQPFKLNLVFVGQGDLSIKGKSYPDTIRIAFSINDRESEGMLWYARGIGMVKANYSDGEYWTLESEGLLPDPAPEIEKVYYEKTEEGGGDLVVTGRHFQTGAAAIILGKRRETLVESASLIRVSHDVAAKGELPVVTIINPDLQTAFYEVAKQPVIGEIGGTPEGPSDCSPGAPCPPSNAFAVLSSASPPVSP